MSRSRDARPFRSLSRRAAPLPWIIHRALDAGTDFSESDAPDCSLEPGFPAWQAGGKITFLQASPVSGPSGCFHPPRVAGEAARRTVLKYAAISCLRGSDAAAPDAVAIWDPGFGV